jgi:hypothetical protein
MGHLQFLQLWKCNSLSLLAIALAIGAADPAGFIGAEKQNPAQLSVGVNPGRRRSGIRNLESRESLSFRPEWRYGHKDFATRIGRLSNADRQYILGLRKYPLDRAKADPFGGTITGSAQTDTNKRSSTAFGSRKTLFISRSS